MSRLTNKILKEKCNIIFPIDSIRFLFIRHLFLEFLSSLFIHFCILHSYYSSIFASICSPVHSFPQTFLDLKFFFFFSNIQTLQLIYILLSLNTPHSFFFWHGSIPSSVSYPFGFLWVLWVPPTHQEYWLHEFAPRCE